MHWVGIPIMMTCNSLHKYFKQTTYLKNPLSYREGEKSKCEKLESHRKAFMNRINFTKIYKTFHGTVEFPYEENDLAHYLKMLSLNVNNEVQDNVEFIEQEEEHE